MCVCVPHRCLESYGHLDSALLVCLQKGGSKGLYVGNLLVDMLQDILDIIGHQNFNLAPSMDKLMTGIPWHPTRDCGHT